MHMSDRGVRPLEWFATAFYASPVPVSISTLDGARLIDVNDSFVRVFGYSREELLGRSTLEVGLWVKPEERAAHAERIRREGALRNVEISLRRKSGELVPALASVDLVAIGDESCLIASYQDLSEIRRLEAQVQGNQKMGALGRLAGGVAHDFNNLLTAILGHCGLALQEGDPSDPRGRHIEGIRKAAERAAGLTRQLLAFSRRQALQPVAIDLRALVADMEGLLKQLLGEAIELVNAVDPVVGRIRADRSQMEQVILNLAVNGRDAMPHGGRLVIEASNADLPTTSAPSPHGRFVRLAIRDTGCGMDRETLSHLFEPFFTTKPPGKGTGLGLATVYGIVTQSGGAVRVESEPGKGTTVEIRFPRTVEPAREAGSAATGPRGGGREALLLVEDEESVRSLAKEVLQKSGYSVLEARDGTEAVRLCSNPALPIDLLLTDVVMPVMSGREVAERVLRLRPGIKVLYMSGYTDSAVFHHGVQRSETELLEKPFTPDDLSRKVREVLDGRRSA